MDQFLRDYDEYCTQVAWEKELMRNARIWDASLVKETSRDPDQIILNLETHASKYDPAMYPDHNTYSPCQCAYCTVERRLDPKDT